VHRLHLIKKKRGVVKEITRCREKKTQIAVPENNVMLLSATQPLQLKISRAK
jgi:hypothetical protein